MADAPREAVVTEVAPGLLRITLPLPWALDHVHCYALPDPLGWTIVDTGLGSRGTADRWHAVLEQLGGPAIRQLVVTHYHPDHLGCAAVLAEELQVDEVVQGDSTHTSRTRCGETRTWAASRRTCWTHGMPDELASASADAETRLAVTPVEPTRVVVEGDTVEAGGIAFDVLHLPGHADGHIALLDRGRGRLFGGDVILHRITPNIGRWEDTARDPLGRYLATLDRLDAIAPAIVYPGHHEPVEHVRVRSAELRAHHEDPWRRRATPCSRRCSRPTRSPSACGRRTGSRFTSTGSRSSRHSPTSSSSPNAAGRWRSTRAAGKRRDAGVGVAALGRCHRGPPGPSVQLQRPVD